MIRDRRNVQISLSLEPFAGRLGVVCSCGGFGSCEGCGSRRFRGLRCSMAVYSFKCEPRAYNGQPEAVKVLVGTLVNLDVRDQAGRTPLYVAVQQGHADCVDILTRHGASALVKERLTKGTSLHIA
ncbi:hypothetical protein chiPu_0026939, partial [Chiloscyllium punctatum]|nr:hypothetical protein [Chiloscyllium punctatum]